MDRNQFIIVTAAALFVAFLVGWFASWVVHRLTRASGAELGELERLGGLLHDAEQARDSAVLELETREADLTARLSRADSLRQAAQDELRETRTEVEELRVYIEQKLARGKSGG